MSNLRVRLVSSGQKEEEWSTSCVVEMPAVSFALVSHIYVEPELAHTNRSRTIFVWPQGKHKPSTGTGPMLM